MDKYTELKKKLLFTLWIIDRAVSRIAVQYIEDVSTENTELYEGLIDLLREERRNLLVEYSGVVGNITEFNREYTNYANKKEGRA